MAESQSEFFNVADYFIDRNIRQGLGHKVAIYTRKRNYTYNDIQKSYSFLFHPLGLSSNK